MGLGESGKRRSRQERLRGGSKKRLEEVDREAGMNKGRSKEATAGGMPEAKEDVKRAQRHLRHTIEGEIFRLIAQRLTLLFGESAKTISECTFLDFIRPFRWSLTALKTAARRCVEDSICTYISSH